MTLIIEIPSKLESELRQRLGDDLRRNAAEAMAVEWYRQRLISHGQFAELLSLSRYEADGVLKRHGVMLEVDPGEFDREFSSLRELLPPKS